jgi:hypothetical protein
VGRLLLQDLKGVLLRGAVPLQEDVGMGVDQPGQQAALPEVDHLGAGRYLPAKLGDPPLTHDHHHALPPAAGLKVEHPPGPDGQLSIPRPGGDWGGHPTALLPARARR